MLDTHESDLIRAAQSGDGAATAELLNRYSPALNNAARRWAAALGEEDAAQEAMCAFLECLRDFDSTGDLQFVQVVRMNLQRSLSDAAGGREPFSGIDPRSYRRYLAAIRDADGDVNLALERCTDNRHLSRGMFLAILHASRGTSSLDELTEAREEFGHWTKGGQSAEGSLDISAEPLYPANPMFRPTLPTPSEIADVHYALSVVDDRERLVCKYAYGFIENRPLSGAEVADAMPIPTERGRRWTEKTVNDTRRKALDKMRAALVA